MGAGMGVLGGRSVLPGGAALATRAGRLVAGTREEAQGPRRLWAAARWPGRSGAAAAGAASAAAADVEHPPPTPDPSAGAFFDVDNTLMRGASIYHFARGLAARKMFGPRDLAEMAWKQVYFRVRGAENPGHIDAAREAALAFVAGHKVSDIVALCEEIYDEDMANRIWGAPGNWRSATWRRASGSGW